MSGSEESKRLRAWHAGVVVAMFVVSLAIAVVAAWVPATRFPLPVYTFYGSVAAFRFNITTIWLLLAATLINGIWHLYYILREETWCEYYKSIRVSHDGFRHHLSRHVNSVRWSLYGIFTSLIVLVIAQHAVVTDAFTLVAIVVLNVLIQRTAYVLEMANRYTAKTKQASLSSIFFGTLAWVAIWTTIVFHHFGNPELVSTPVWVYVAVIGTALATILFGAVALFRYTSNGKFWKHDLIIEEIYLVLEVLIVLVSVGPILIGGIVA